MPWLQAGQSALGGIEDLLGLSGAGAQGSAIEALRGSPLFASLFDRGQEAILQNASATGGLRGGNTNVDLADFGRDTLAQVIQNQMANLGGLSGTGVGTAQNLGALGANNASNIANLLQQGGAAQAGGILAKGSRDRTAFNDAMSIASMFAGFGGFGGGGGGEGISVTPMGKRGLF